MGIADFIKRRWANHNARLLRQATDPSEMPTWGVTGGETALEVADGGVLGVPFGEGQGRSVAGPLARGEDRAPVL